MAWRGSISRSIATTIRSIRTSPSSSSAFRHPSLPLSASRLPCRTASFSSLSRPLSPLGGLQSLVTRQGVSIPQLASHMPLAVTACRQLSQASCKAMTRQLTTVVDKRNIGDYKRRLLAAKYGLRRKLYKALCQDPDFHLIYGTNIEISCPSCHETVPFQGSGTVVFIRADLDLCTSCFALLVLFSVN